FSSKYALTRHTQAVNALAVSMHGALLLTGGNDSQIAVWNLVSGEMIQEIFAPAAGYISAIVWVDIDDRGESAFAFGASDGNIQIYERSNDVSAIGALFEIRSTTIGHSGAVESLAWDPVHRRLASTGDGLPLVWNLTPDKTLTSIISQPDKQPYVARTVHFYDNGASLLVSFLESGEIFCYSIEPWDLKWRKKRNTALEGNFLLVSNLKDGVDKYAIPTLQRVQSYSHVILHNVPLQISVARQAGLIFVGGDDGFARIFDYSSGAHRGQLQHGSRGDRIIPVAVSHLNLVFIMLIRS
ncbi:WD40-repeat-containing domain protein, partial [Suillus tomentosus]